MIYEGNIQRILAETRVSKEKSLQGHVLTRQTYLDKTNICTTQYWYAQQKQTEKTKNCEGIYISIQKAKKESWIIW